MAILKSIVEVDPPRMSSVAKGARLQRALRGDLDTIVAKALKKNPEERYASVAEFADDLRRFVDHQPISARPDTVRYRATKFIRRHRRGLAAVAGVVLIVGGLVTFYTVQLARQADKASRMSELLTNMLTAADPYRDPDGHEPTVRGLLDVGADRVTRDLSGQPELQAEMFTVLGRTYRNMGLYAKAQPLLEKALTLARRTLGPEHVRLAQSLNDLGVLHREQGNVAAAVPLLEESLAMRRRLLGSDDKLVAVTLVELARALKDCGRNAEAEPLIRESLAIRRKVFGEEHRETATSKNELGLLLWEQGDLDGAEKMFRESMVTHTRLLGADHANAAVSKANLAVVLNEQGHPAAAEALLRESLASQRKTLGVRHPSYANTLNKLSVVVMDQGRLDEANAVIEEALRTAGMVFSGDHPRMVLYRVNQARIQIARHEPARAEPVLRHLLEVRERFYPEGDWRIGQVQSLLGASLIAQGRASEAEPLLLEAAKTLKPIPGQQGRDAGANRALMDSLRDGVKSPGENRAHPATRQTR